jgi:creatinine amidohydrolase
MPSPDRRYRYAELTWPEVAERAAEDPVCVIPVATLEDHGYHLPIDTDVRIAEGLAERAVARRADRALLLPTVTHGYTPHHMEFPGPITIDWKTFVDYLLDIGKSLFHHGFARILFVNGHGSNAPLVEMAARLLMTEHPGRLAGAFWYLSNAESAALLERTRESAKPGGMAHACELETSLYLALAPELVQMDKAVREIPDWGSENVWMDWSDGPLAVRERWSVWTESGVMGDATVATAEKGRVWLERAVEEICEYIDELAARPRRLPRDHHNGAADVLGDAAATNTPATDDGSMT